jgi:methylated-DNA-protein-cysteine methyltransferase-like protein
MSVYQSVYEIVQSIPPGRVLTYGLISNLLGGRLSAQGVGWALRALPSELERLSKQKAVKKASTARYSSDIVPWHRVINSQGGISTRRILGLPWDLQRELLENEGVVFDHEEKTDLEKYLWWEGIKSLDKADLKLAKPPAKLAKKSKTK